MQRPMLTPHIAHAGESTRQAALGNFIYGQGIIDDILMSQQEDVDGVCAWWFDDQLHVLFFDIIGPSRDDRFPLLSSTTLQSGMHHAEVCYDVVVSAGYK